jgi:DNA-binding response OmpR family regulator
MDQVTAVQSAVSAFPDADVLATAGVSPRRGAILVVEDRDDVREGLAQLLELHGFLVLDAADGEHALVHLRADPDTFALVLLDLMLPGAISGHHVRASQLADSRLAAIPTIVVSACEPETPLQAQLRPAAWVEKPFRFDVLLRIVKRFVAPEGNGFTLA